MENRSIVYLTPSTFCLEMRIVDKRRKSRSFCINRSALIRWLNKQPYNGEAFYDKDLHSFLRVIHDSCGRLQFHISWLTSTCGDQLKGYVQHFSLPFAPVLEAAKGDKRTAVLTLPDNTFTKARITLAASAHARLPSLSMGARRAFVKALRDRFFWPDATLILYADGKHDFFFREYRVDGSVGICGGLILTRKTNRLGFAEYSYEMHT